MGVGGGIAIGFLIGIIICGIGLMFLVAWAIVETIREIVKGIYK